MTKLIKVHDDTYRRLKGKKSEVDKTFDRVINVAMDKIFMCELIFNTTDKDKLIEKRIINS